MKHDLPKTFFPFIWHFLRDHKGAVTLYTFLALAAGLWGPFNSMIMKHIINLLPSISANDMGDLALPGALIVLNFIVFDNITWRSINYIKCRFLPLMLNKMDKTLLDRTLQHTHQFFQERMAGSLSKQVFHLIDGFEKIVSSTASNILRATSLMIMAFLLAYQVNVLFFIILLLWSLAFCGVSLLMSKKLTALSEAHASTESVLGGQIIDSLTHAFSVSLFAHRAHEITRRQDALLANQRAYRQKELYALKMHIIQGGLIAVMMAFSVFCGLVAQPFFA